MKTDKSMLECYDCEHKENIDGSSFLRCNNPDYDMMGDKYGIDNDWFDYPESFDPVWKKDECANYKERL